MDFDPFTLSREVERADQRYRVFHRSLKRSLSVTDPFLGSELFGRTTFEQVQRLSVSDPMRRPLLRWVHRLTERRIHVPWTVKEAELERAEEHGLCAPVDARLTLRQLRHFSLFGPVEERPGYLKAWFQSSFALSAHRGEMLARETEIARLLHIEDAHALWSPLAVEKQDGFEDALDTSESLAQEALQVTKSVAEELVGPGYLGFASALCLSPLTEGWPARLSPDVLRGLFLSRELFLGVTPDPDPLPERLCPASFVRAGVLLGQALSLAARPLDLPYVVARDPDDLLGYETGALFFFWMLSRQFQIKGLGLSAARVREQRRATAAGIVTAVRLQAARVLLSQAALRGRAAVTATYAELTHTLLGQELPEGSALVSFRARGSEPARWVAFLSAAARVGHFQNTYDEDWYQNPRAQEELRATLGQPESTVRSASTCRAGLARLLSLCGDF